MNSLRQLIPYLRPYRSTLWIGVICAVLNNAIGALTPWVLKLAVDDFSNSISRSKLLLYAGGILAIALVAGVLRYYMRKLMIGVSRYVELDLRNHLFAKLQHLSASFYNRQRTGDLMTRMTNDMDSVRNVLGPGIMYPVDTITTAAFSLSMMIILSPKLTLYVVLLAPLVSASVYYLGRVTYKLHTRIQEQYSSLSDQAQENLSGVRVVRSFGQEESEIRKFSELNQEYVRRNLDMAKVQAMFIPVMILMFELGTAMILLLGGRGIIKNELTLGDFVAFVGYLGMLAWPMIAVGWVANLFQRGAASFKRITELLNLEPEIANPEQTKTPAAIHGEITFEHVSFAYSEHKKTLHDINLAILPGQTIAIVGRTGSGKTSLISLIPRLFDPAEGRILIDGIPTTEWDLKQLRSIIGMVPQDTLLFSDTVRENIVFGNPEFSEDDFLDAVEISQIRKDVEGFREGFQATVGERGITLSGGQKGRTALARALLRNPKILILDDCLSAVDTHTEEEILKGLRRFTKDRTTIIVSHRVSTVKHAQEIIVLDQGAIVERGNHEALIALGGYYADLDRMQRLEEELESEA